LRTRGLQEWLTKLDDDTRGAIEQLKQLTHQFKVHFTERDGNLALNELDLPVTPYYLP
jgi:signal recognition particle GTPase